MFLPQAPSPSRNTPPPAQPLERDLPKSPVLMLSPRHDSPPRACLALTWPVLNKDQEDAVSPSQLSTSVKTYSSPDACNMYQQSRAVVFDSPSGHRTVCLQNTVCYTMPPNSPSGSSFSFGVSHESPEETGHVSFSSPSPSKHGSLHSTPGRNQSWSGSGKDRKKASPGSKTSPTRNLGDGSRSPQNRANSRDQGSPESQVRQRRHPESKKDLQVPRDGGRPGRNMAGSDRYQGILEQDHPEETLSRGLLGSCFCYLILVILLALLVVTFLVWSFGAPSLLSVLGTNNKCPDLNISRVRHDLEGGLIGQPVASKLIIDALSRYREDRDKPLILFFHGSSGVGKTHTANIITRALLSELNVDSCIQPFNADSILKFEKAPSKQVFSQAFEDWVNGTVKGKSEKCCLSFFIFDDIHEETPQELTQALGQFLSKFTSHYPSSEFNTERKIFIIMTMLGSQSISDFLSANMKRGHDRHSLTLQGINWQEPWRHLTTNLDKHDPFWTWLPASAYVRIPFLPLERNHIKQCARHCLERKNLTATDEHLEWVADQLMYFPDSWPIFSTSGCKKVAGKVDLIYREKPRHIFDFKKPF